jgi:hypothetical protein
MLLMELAVDSDLLEVDKTDARRIRSVLVLQDLLQPLFVYNVVLACRSGVLWPSGIILGSVARVGLAAHTET